MRRGPLAGSGRGRGGRGVGGGGDGAAGVTGVTGSARTTQPTWATEAAGGTEAAGLFGERGRHGVSRRQDRRRWDVRGEQAGGGQPVHVDQGVEGGPAQRAGDVRGRAPAVDQVQHCGLPGRDRGAGRPRGPCQRGLVRRRVGPDAVQQRPAAQRLALHGRHGHRVHGAEPVRGPVAEAGRGAARFEDEVRGVVQRPEVAQFQRARGQPSPVHQVPAHPSALPGLGERLVPALRVEHAVRAEQEVEAGGVGALGVHHLAVGQIERAALPDEYARGPLGGEPDQHRGEGAGGYAGAVPHRQGGRRGCRRRRRGGDHRHPSTSRPAISPRRIRASARLPSARDSHRCRKTLLSKVVGTKRSRW